MRATYLVCYDVANDKRLRKVFKTCGNFGDHLQFSVFECDFVSGGMIVGENRRFEITFSSASVFFQLHPKNLLPSSFLR